MRATWAGQFRGQGRLFGLAFLVTTMGWCSADAATLFTTQNDFSSWTSGATFTVAPAATPDLDGSSTNGLASNGGAGTPGSLSLDWNSSTFDNSIRSGGLQGNASLISALSSNSIFKARYTKPTSTAGNYLQLGMVLNYDGHFDQLGFTEVDNGDGTFTGTVPYSFNPSSLTYLQVGILWNSNWEPANNFYVDSIEVIPEPATLVLLAGSLIGVAWSRRRPREA